MDFINVSSISNENGEGGIIQDIIEREAAEVQGRYLVLPTPQETRTRQHQEQLTVGSST